MARYRIRIAGDLDKTYLLPDWDALHQFWPENRALTLEIGSGFGELLLELALRDQAGIFIGLEADYRRVLKSTEAVWRRQLSNVRFFHCKVDEQLPVLLRGRSIQTLHIHHPDPWDKRRQFKHRIVRLEMLKIFYDILLPKSDLWLSTDHVEYSQWMLREIRQSGLFQIDEDDFLSTEALKRYNLPTTRFHEKLRQKGFESRFLHCVKQLT